MASLILKPGHVQPLWSGHPWVYAQAVARAEGGPVAGDEITVRDPRGQALGRGFYSAGSALPVRLFAREGDARPFAQLLRERLDAAWALRARFGLGDSEHTGYRVVHAEGDGLPGLIVDRFGDALVVQFLTLGMQLRREQILGELLRSARPYAALRCVLDRTPQRAAQLEGFELPSSPWLHGAEIDALRFVERGLRYELPLSLAQKTGFYFDQRGVRARIEALSRGANVLDTYCFVGAFSMAAARGGALAVQAIDDSLLATEVGAQQASLNDLAERIRFRKGDARRELAASRAEHDLVIVDPPRLSPTRSAQRQALAGYSKLAELGARAVKPGGLLVFCSCSAAIDVRQLTRALALGAQRAGCTPQVLERHFQGIDHPVPAAFDEGLYLKVLIARIERSGAQRARGDA